MFSHWESNTEELKGKKEVDNFTLHVGVSHIELGIMRRKRGSLYIQLMGYITLMVYEKMYAHCYVYDSFVTGF